MDFPSNSSHSGTVFLNKNELTYEEIKSKIKYVAQEDILSAFLSPREILTFTARMKFKESKEWIDNKVNEILKDLRLEKCAETFVGDHLNKGLSGGEKKRTAIATELILNPTILFLDEPTAGLDSDTSFIILNLLHEYAIKKNAIILSTIHQPSSNIFNLFSRLVILNQGIFYFLINF